MNHPFVEICCKDSRRLEEVLRRREATAMDKVLRRLIDLADKNKKYYVHMGTLDVMCDAIIAEALSVGMSSDEIAHAMFSCDESLEWLRERLEPLNLGEPLRETILHVLHLGIPVRTDLFGKALLSVDECITFDNNSEHVALDLSGYTKTSWLGIQEGGMMAYQHPDGVYRLVGKTITYALVPHLQGVNYYRRDNEITSIVDFFSKPPIIHRSGKGAHFVQETVNELVKFGCDYVIAWRLVAAVIMTQPTPDPGVWQMVVQSFRVISGYHSELQSMIKRAKSGTIGKSLMGTKKEIVPNTWFGVDPKFFPERRLYLDARVKGMMDHTCVLDTGFSRLSYRLTRFTSEFLAMDSLETHATLLGRLVDKARTSAVNKGKEKKGDCLFNVWTLAVFGLSTETTSNAMRSQRAWDGNIITKMPPEP